MNLFFRWVISSMILLLLLCIMSGIYAYTLRVSLLEQYLHQKLSPYGVSQVDVEALSMVDLSRTGLSFLLPSLTVQSTFTPPFESAPYQLVTHAKNTRLVATWRSLWNRRSAPYAALQELNLSITRATSNTPASPPELTVLDILPQPIIERLPFEKMTIDRLLLEYPADKSPLSLPTQWAGRLHYQNHLLSSQLQATWTPPHNGTITDAIATEGHYEERIEAKIEAKIEANIDNHIEILLSQHPLDRNRNDNRNNNLNDKESPHSATTLMALTLDVDFPPSAPTLNLVLQGNLNTPFVQSLFTTHPLASPDLQTQGFFSLTMDSTLPIDPLSSNQSNKPTSSALTSRTLWQHPQFEAAANVTTSQLSIHQTPAVWGYTNAQISGSAALTLRPGEWTLTPHENTTLALQGPNELAHLTLPLNPQWQLILNGTTQWYLGVKQSQPITFGPLKIAIRKGHLNRQGDQLILQGAIHIKEGFPEAQMDFHFQQSLAQRVEQSVPSPSPEWSLDAAGTLKSSATPFIVTGEYRPALESLGHIQVKLQKPMTKALQQSLATTQRQWTPWLEYLQPQLALWLTQLATASPLTPTQTEYPQFQWPPK